MTRREFCLGLSASLAVRALGGTNAVRDFTRYSWVDYDADLLQQGREATWQGIRQYVVQHGEATNGIVQIANFPMMYEHALSLTEHGLHRPCVFSRELSHLMASQFRSVGGSCSYFVNAGVGDLVGTCLILSGNQNCVCNILDDDLLEAGICRDVILSMRHHSCSIVNDCEFPDSSRVLSVLADADCLHLGKLTNYRLLMKLLDANCASVTLCPLQLLHEVNLASVKRNLHVMTISPRAAYDSTVRSMSQLAILTVERRA